MGIALHWGWYRISFRSKFTWSPLSTPKFISMNINFWFHLLLSFDSRQKSVTLWILKINSKTQSWHEWTRSELSPNFIFCLFWVNSLTESCYPFHWWQIFNILWLKTLFLCEENMLKDFINRFLLSSKSMKFWMELSRLPHTKSREISSRLRALVFLVDNPVTIYVTLFSDYT